MHQLFALEQVRSGANTWRIFQPQRWRIAIQNESITAEARGAAIATLLLDTSLGSTSCAA